MQSKHGLGKRHDLAEREKERENGPALYSTLRRVESDDTARIQPAAGEKKALRSLPNDPVRSLSSRSTARAPAGGALAAARKQTSTNRRTGTRLGVLLRRREAAEQEYMKPGSRMSG